MVNKCIVIGCISRTFKYPVKLHRFPLKNAKTLPFWIAFTGKEPGWKPTQSSRLCLHHFIASDYKTDHKKGVLKPTAVPTIKYELKYLATSRRYKIRFKQIQNNQDTKEKMKPNSSSNYDDYDNQYGNNNDNRKMQGNILTKNWVDSLLNIPTVSASTDF